jgi:hypothetical protein
MRLLLAVYGLVFEGQHPVVAPSKLPHYPLFFHSSILAWPPCADPQVSRYRPAFRPVRTVQRSRH